MAAGAPAISLETSMPGVFAAGDVRQGAVRRVASAVGEGSIAIQLVHNLLASEQLAPGRSEKELVQSACGASATP